MERELVYLACPYVHEERVVREARFVQATIAAAHLMKQGHVVFSPITHGHPMAVHASLPTGWQFWGRIDKTFLKYCSKMFVLPIEGWYQSEGIKQEFAVADQYNIEILWLDPETLDIDWEGSVRKYRRKYEQS